ncbi:F0F1 ATP synthase subunit delta [Lactococcus fujiensis]|uniref:F0F1 ATP synthase subunit delta n=1 Tax=Lactococcus fujiensis TaxID=610251 RepID=UPI000AF15538|nr:F0F1 ATP synthase subunit delta [Lactococcus fujiensis]
MTKINSQKYSKALLEIAQKQNKVKEILDEVKELTQLFETSNLKTFFASDVYSVEAKSQIIDTINQSASELMRNFLNTVRANGRLSSLMEILEEVNETADSMFKIADVEVVSSVPLTDEQLAKFSQLAQSKFDLSTVNLINKVDEKNSRWFCN